MPTGVTELVDDVYDITVSNRYGRRYRSFLLDYDTPTLVDTGYEDSVAVLVDKLAELGIAPERLVITHGDPDHIGGAAAIADEYGAETWVPSATAELSFSPDHRYGDSARIGTFEAVHVPGHSPDSSALVDETRGIAVMGDTIYGADLRGLPPGYPIMPAAGLTEDPHAAEKNLEKLLDFEFSVALVYHGSSILENASEKLEAFVNYPGKELAHY